MPIGEIHVRKAQQLCIPEEVASKVTKLKDYPARYLPGYIHRGFNHGLGTNTKYLRIHGIYGVLASIHHNLLDRIGFTGKVGRRILGFLQRLLQQEF